MAKLSKSPVIERKPLETLATSRLKESQALRKARCYAGAVYLQGCAVECYLKAVICKTLDSDNLPATFMTHDLDLLLLHSGLARRIRSVPRVHESFGKILKVWTMEGKNAIRYRSPQDFKENDARDFSRWVSHRSEGVVPWLKKQI